LIEVIVALQLSMRTIGGRVAALTPQRVLLVRETARLNLHTESGCLTRMLDARDGATSLAVSGSHVPGVPARFSRNSWRSGASTTVQTGNRAAPPLPSSCAGKSALELVRYD
jgi:hypothetical protein